VIAVALVGIGFGVRALVVSLRQPGSVIPPTAAGDGATGAALPFSPDRALPGPDLNGDGEPEQVVISAPVMGEVEMGLATGPAGHERLIGTLSTLPAAPLSLVDLPRAQDVLVWEGTLPSTGEPVPVEVGGEPALVARGGEPDRRAWRLDPAGGLVSVDYYALAAPLTPPEPTVILIDKGLNVLWYYQDGQLVQTARVATGRHIEGPTPSAANRMENLSTPAGRFTVDYMAPGLPYYKEGIPALDPANPLGTRWIGFAAYPGDDGTIWAIHGTNDPASLGQWVSDGCIRMANAEVERLYEAVAPGTPIVIQNSLAAPVVH